MIATFTGCLPQTHAPLEKLTRSRLHYGYICVPLLFSRRWSRCVIDHDWINTSHMNSTCSNYMTCVQHGLITETSGRLLARLHHRLLSFANNAQTGISICMSGTKSIFALQMKKTTLHGWLTRSALGRFFHYGGWMIMNDLPSLKSCEI